jgi:hypothetical protein
MNFHASYEHLFQKFHIGAPTFVLLKNISTTSSGIVKYRTNLCTIFILVINEEVMNQLTYLHEITMGMEQGP